MLSCGVTGWEDPQAMHPNATPHFHTFFVVTLIGLSFGIMAFSIDAVVPSLDLIREEFAITTAQAQLNLSVMIAMSGMGQLVFGPLSDRIGRRPAMLTGILVFLLGSLCCVLAPSLSWLLLGRACQGVGAAAPLVIGRAILRDLYTGRKLVQMFSLSFAFMGILPILAPALGYWITEILNWRAVFGALAIYGCLMLAFTMLKFQETLAVPNPHAMRPSILWRATVTVLRHPQSRLFLILQLLTTSGMFAYVISAQQIYAVTYGITGPWFALAYGASGSGVIVGQLCNQFLVNRYGTAEIMLGFLFLLLATSIAGILMVSAGWLGPILFGCLAFALVLGVMVLVASSSAMIMDPHSEIAGFTSSLMGMIVFGFGSLGGTLLAYLCAGNPAYLFGSLFLIMATGVAILVYWLRQAYHAMPAVV